MKKKVVIIGGRQDGHAKVVLKILLLDNQLEVAGFLDDDIGKKGLNICGYPILGGMKDLPDLIQELSIEAGIVAIGNNEQRRSLSEILQQNGIQLINAIHPSVILDDDVELGVGNYLGQGVVVVTGTRIGNNVNIHTGATIDHDNRIEDGANLGPGVHTSGRVTVGKDAFIGVGSCVIPDVNVGEGAILGGGTVVIRDVPAHTKMVGNPAQQIPM